MPYEAENISKLNLEELNYNDIDYFELLMDIDRRNLLSKLKLTYIIGNKLEYNKVKQNIAELEYDINEKNKILSTSNYTELLEVLDVISDGEIDMSMLNIYLDLICESSFDQLKITTSNKKLLDGFYLFVMKKHNIIL